MSNGWVNFERPINQLVLHNSKIQMFNPKGQKKAKLLYECTKNVEGSRKKYLAFFRLATPRKLIGHAQ